MLRRRRRGRRKILRRLAPVAPVAPVLLWSMVLAGVVVGPMARGGWVLLLDWVTGPRVDFAQQIGSGSSLPAGPLFFAFAALVRAVAGAAVGWLVPWCVLVAAGVGGARLVTGPDGSSSGGRFVQLTASTAALWNPFVHERLYSGQLAVLAGYAAMLFLARATLNATPEAGPDAGHVCAMPGPRVPASVRIGLIWSAAAACSIHFLLFGALVVGVCVVAAAITSQRRLRHLVQPAGTALVIAVVVTGAWLVPRLDGTVRSGDERTVAAFSTRPDANVGLLGGAALQRGFWRASPGEPGSDRGWLWLVADVGLGVAAVAGLVMHWRRGIRALVLAVSVGGAIGWIAGQGAHGPLGGAFLAFTRLPGMLMLRESGKFLFLVTMTWIVGLAGFAQVVGEVLRQRSPRRGLRPSVCAAMVLSPIVLTPGLAWGVGGRLGAVHYPTIWADMQRTLRGDPARGRIVIVPFTRYFDPGFTGGRVVMGTTRAYFGDRAVESDDAEVPGLVASSGTQRLAAVLRTARPARSLRAEGVGWVLVQTGNRFEGLGLTVAAADDVWTLYRVS